MKTKRRKKRALRPKTHTDRKKHSSRDPQSRIERLLAFANQRDIERLPDDALGEAYDFIFDFVRGDAKGLSVEEEEPRSGAALLRLQEALCSGLRQGVKLDRSPLPGGGEAVVSVFYGWEVSLEGLKRYVLRGQSAYHGTLRAVLLAALADLIANDRAKRLAMCQRPTCERFFWKKDTRQNYCSKNCADADRQKRWRTKETVKSNG